VKVVAIHHLEQLVIVAVVDMYADDYRPRRVECRLHDGPDVVECVDHEARCTIVDARDERAGCGYLEDRVQRLIEILRKRRRDDG
jgi:hypothetical protein